MTKAELLKRYSWIWIVLPLLSFASSHLFLLVFVFRRWGRIPLPSAFQFLLDISFAVVPLGWIALTLTCSAFTAFLRVEDAQLRGALRIPVLVLVALMVFALHVIACVVLFAIIAPLVQ